MLYDDIAWIILRRFCSRGLLAAFFTSNSSFCSFLSYGHKLSPPPSMRVTFLPPPLPKKRQNKIKDGFDCLRFIFIFFDNVLILFCSLKSDIVTSLRQPQRLSYSYKIAWCWTKILQKISVSPVSCTDMNWVEYIEFEGERCSFLALGSACHVKTG